jgi:hypothetical protein
MRRDWRNYEEIYLEDECLKELEDDARVWRVHNSEDNRIYAEMAERLK